MTTNNNISVVTPDTFFSALETWKEWVQKGKDSGDVRLAIVATKPREAQHDCNLYLDENNRVWSHLGAYWYINTRSSDALYAHYVRGVGHKDCGPGDCEKGSVVSITLESEEKVLFVKRSWLDNMVEDWGWEIRPKDVWPGGCSTYEHTLNSLRYSERGLRLAGLLGVQKAEIQVWMGEYAFRRDDDWKDFLRKFAPEFVTMHVPDNGSVLCALHMVLDQIQFGKQIHGYAY